MSDDAATASDQEAPAPGVCPETGPSGEKVGLLSENSALVHNPPFSAEVMGTIGSPFESKLPRPVPMAGEIPPAPRPEDFADARELTRFPHISEQDVHRLIASFEMNAGMRPAALYLGSAYCRMIFDPDRFVMVANRAERSAADGKRYFCGILVIQVFEDSVHLGAGMNLRRVA